MKRFLKISLAFAVLTTVFACKREVVPPDPMALEMSQWSHFEGDFGNGSALWRVFRFNKDGTATLEYLINKTTLSSPGTEWKYSYANGKVTVLPYISGTVHPFKYEGEYDGKTMVIFGQRYLRDSL